MSCRLSNEIRRKFVDYFVSKHGHKFIKSSSVKPDDDSTLSFVNAGMNQFKSIFLSNAETFNPSRACNYQKCIRVGGKMCDLGKIGYDFTHHTFFEMLGNWSFNDYGKPEACEWALDFLVNHLKLESSKLSVTYFSSKEYEDIETRDIWLGLGIPPERVLPNEEGDNFWDMGTSGPCGLSTEIFYRNGSDLVEIWNLVFIDRYKMPGKDEILHLKRRFVDTGMGLERIVAVMSGRRSNYDTDLFASLFKAIESKSGVKPYTGSLKDYYDIHYRILADHCRMITIALTDGIEPGRRGNSFDLRTIIKKTVLISRDVFKQEKPRYLLFDLVDETVDILGEAYPELPLSVKHIRRTLASESKRYLAYVNKQESQLSE